MQPFDPLPLEVCPHDDESGLGYCLRAAAANGINLHWIRSVCGLGYAQMPTSANARVLSDLLGCSESWLSRALPTHAREAGGSAWSVNGQLILSRSHLRGRLPQLCPMCVHESGYCRAAWEFSMYTVCAEHRTELIDRCGHCHAPIRWDRPSIEICHCGWPFGSGGSSSPHENRCALALAEHIQSAVSETSTHPGPGWLPPFTADLSLDGLGTVIQAFGANEVEYSVAPSYSRTKLQTTQHWRVVVLRGVERLQSVVADPSRSPSVAPYVNEASLRRLLTRYVLENDHLAARELLRTTLGATLENTRRQSLQMQLFPI